MPTGRHARETAAPAQPLVTPDDLAMPLPAHRRARAVLLVDDDLDVTAAPTGTARRRKTEPTVEAPAPPEVDGDVAPGSGRRRKASAEVTTEAGPAPTGRRRKAALVEAPADVPAAGTGRRRRVAAEPEVAAAPEIAPAPVAPEPEEPTPTPAAEVVPIAAAHRHRRGHRAKSSLPTPGNPALVAGAAAVALAAVGAVATTAGGVQFGAAGTDLARASALGLAQPLAQPASPNAERASRDRAREVLALRLKAQEKQDALAKALKLAQQRAARLAVLAREFILPVKGYHLTAGFGEGGGLWSHGHTGQDFACPSGTPIHALASGTIVYTGWYGAYGWLTVERLADATEIWYAHQSKILVHSGPVVAGQVIGRVGSTGNTTGPHLHLEVHPHGGPPVDPMPWLRQHGMHP